MQVWSNRVLLRWCWAAIFTLAAAKAGTFWLTPSLCPSAHHFPQGAISTANAAPRVGQQSFVVQAQFSAINPRSRGNAFAKKPLRLPAVEVAPAPQRLPPVEIPLVAKRLPPVDESSNMLRLPPPMSIVADNAEPSPFENESSSDPIPDLIPVDALSPGPHLPSPIDDTPHDLPAPTLPLDVPADIAGQDLPTDTNRDLPSPKEAAREVRQEIGPIASTDVPLHETPELNSAIDPPVATPQLDRSPTALDPNDPLRSIPDEMRHDWNDAASALSVAGRQAEQLVRGASNLATRGATYSSRRELETALVVVAQAMDSHYATTAYTQCLRRGLLAMEEAADFAPSHARGQLNLDVALIVSRHQSRAIAAEEAGRCTPVEATRKYHSFAHDHLAAACGGSPVAAHALFGLGKLYARMSESDSAEERRLGQRAMLLHQTALRIDGSHSLAATELGSLLARFGRLKDARDVLRQGISRNPSPETWRQLANVHTQLGEVELANQAHAEWQRTIQLSRREHPETVTAPNGMTVKWVDKQTFERTGREVGPGRSWEPMPAQNLQTAGQPQRTRKNR